jgi:hypothetical protein
VRGNNYIFQQVSGESSAKAALFGSTHDRIFSVR